MKYLEITKAIPKITSNLRSFVNLEDKEVTKYVCKLLDGILDDATVRRHMPRQFKAK